MAQTTQAFLTGQVIDSVSGQPIFQAKVLCQSMNKTVRLPAETDRGGRFTYAALSPGQYSVLVSGEDYQPQELHLLELPVAGRLELNFRLRPLNDVWEAGRYRSYLLPGSQQTLMFYGPDLDTSRVASFEANHGTQTNLDTSLSTVVDAQTISELPLTGRDVYTVLVLLPGVTADLATARGLGFSVLGQRPSSSNYLLDGLENNDLLITGPLGRIAPESVQEYRISTSNYSAEYGRTSGFLANAITRAGTNTWHELGYLYFSHDKLNANGFQENVRGIGRAPLKQWQPGLSISGPIRRDRLFASASLEFLRSRSRNDPQIFALPTAGFIARSNPNTIGGKLLRQYPAAAVPVGSSDTGLVSIAPPAALDQVLGLGRIDYLSASGRQRLFGRVSINREREPDLLFNPYPQFSSPFEQGAVSFGGGWTWQVTPYTTHELRFGRSGNAARYDRFHSEVPQLVDYENGPADYGISLPASGSSLSYRNIARSWEIVDNWSWTHGKHNWKFGGGLLSRNVDSAFVADAGEYSFVDLAHFVADSPDNLLVAYDRQGSGYSAVPYNRRYRYWNAYGFAQDAFKATTRLTLNYGLRYEFFGAPVNTGPAKDSVLQLGAGASLPERIATAHFGALPAGDQQLFTSDKRNWAVRAGLSYDLTGRGRTLFRSSYGIFYDRPFDNLWQTVTINRQIPERWYFDNPVNILAPPLAVIGQGTIAFESTGYHPPVLFQPHLRNPMVQTVFAGVQQKLADNVTLDVNAVASRGRRLWTTDVVNRTFSVGTNPPDNPSGTYNPSLQNIYYRGNQGQSDYYALTSAVRFRGERWNGQIAYTWSHAIDNQSDALAGAFEDYNQQREAARPDFTALAAFTGQFNSRADRANADFDQRQNLVFYGVYEIPALFQSGRGRTLFRDWRISGLGAIRAGMPFTAYAPWVNLPNAGGFFQNQRADLIQPAATTLSPALPVPGGKILLNAAAFGKPGANAIGTSGRNAFSGPGLLSADLSIARRFPFRILGEAGRVTLRADFYNVFNHANLNNPDSYFTGPHFGWALYGRSEKNSGFPVLAPLNETARQIQILFRVEF
jgi:hypothetical protein